ncbi:hypothetical protein M271_49625 [Streptomyces rapamycinicus NRRL 5491]|uniref:Uncharacterized protein n=2 Tax=Streptomyces rapamycinicus TaxID=1226757 RepID=A0A0A0NNW6_STRRN|nr:hypothetical protein M271_49625 [Streptomyces rapamycinicus NRRL 5491]MBB4787529.1 hypothetical protein [Streptomyces rapamycinicus]RLV71872.1 hypothetical protein D3C57_145135 [Streptomyces rapamycinicus NRRL 5491]
MREPEEAFGDGQAAIEELRAKAEDRGFAYSTEVAMPNRRVVHSWPYVGGSRGCPDTPNRAMPERASAGDRCAGTGEWRSRSVEM